MPGREQLFIFLLWLLPAGMYSQELPPFLQSYFKMKPVERLDMLDSTILHNGNTFVAGFISDDLSSLLGDTTNIERFYSTTGVTMTISSHDGKELSKVFKRWRKCLRKKHFSKSKKTMRYVDYETALTTHDSLVFFFWEYAHLPVLNRIEYFESHLKDTSTSQRAKLALISFDLNAITECSCSPFEATESKWIIRQDEATKCIETWRKAVETMRGQKRHRVISK